METLAMNEFRRQVGEYINQTYYAGKAFKLTKGEKTVAALVPISMLNRMAELEAFQAQALANREDQSLSQLEDTQSSPTETLSPD